MITGIHMRHLRAGLRYELAWRLRSVGIYLLFFLFFVVVLPLVVTMFPYAGDSYGTVDVMAPPIFFGAIVAAIGARVDFRFLLFNGLNRSTVFVSTLISTVVTSATVSLVSVVLRVVLSAGSLRWHTTMTVADQYATGTMTPADPAGSGARILVMWLVGFLLVMTVSCLGVLVGVLMARLSKRGTQMLGAAIFLVPTFIGFLLSRVDMTVLLKWLADFGSTFMGIGQDGVLNFVPLSMTLLTVIAAFLAIAWLTGRRRGVDRIVQR